MFARLKVSAGYMNIKKAIQFRSNKYVSSVLVVHSRLAGGIVNLRPKEGT
jgi:hypothetical protein